MAQFLTKCMLLTILSVVMKHGMLIQGQQQVPCLFFFGDSQSDNGNNNELITLAKVNYPPYGIDFPDGPTGRFSNGQNIPDVLAGLLGFTDSILPFASARGSDIIRGVNHASGAGGILDNTGILQGQRFTLDRQLLNHRTTISRLSRLGRNEDYLRQCLYVVNIGSNDYINNYYLPISLTRLLNSPDMFAQTLIRKFNQQLRQLYGLGARKVAVFGLGLLGCIPQELALYPTNGSPCVDMINNAVQLFNNRLKPLIDQLNNDLTGARFTYINITSISSGDPSQIGITVANAPCCVVSSLTGLCVRNSVPCSNRNEYVFFDNFHPTALLNNITASRAYNAALPSDADPTDIRTLVQQ